MSRRDVNRFGPWLALFAGAAILYGQTPPKQSPPPTEETAKLEADLAQAQSELEESPHDPDKLIWVGRRLGYLRRLDEAINVFSIGIAAHPNDPRFYRHRGHRYISNRQFDLAIADFEHAAKLIEGRPDDIEPDGMPNAKNIPLTSTGFNVWYHLALAKYLRGDFESALSAWKETLRYTRGFDDNLVAVTDWQYMTLRRLGRHDEAAKLLDSIQPDMNIIENHAYHRRLLMYKGLIAPEALLKSEGATDLDIATYGYGVGNWYLCNGETQKALEIFRRVTSGTNGLAFGFIAAETDLARLEKPTTKKP